MTDGIGQAIEALENMTARQLQKRYAEVFGESTRSGNSQWMRRRIAWRLQARAEGDLAERALAGARHRAAEIADDADLRVRPPRDPIAAPGGSRTVSGPMTRPVDHRLPLPGTVLVRRFKGVEHRVTVLPHGFEYGGEIYRSLSAAAYAISGSHWNGFLFFGLKKATRKDRS